MAQSLLIGLGGTGSRIVNNVVKQLHKNGKEINDGQICCAVLDTNCNDNDFIEASGTEVPVIGTSKPQKIRDYFADYPSMLEWSPDSPSFREQSMLAGASETRVKSRIAFEECLLSRTTDELEDLINDVLKQGDTEPLRILLVSSLSGGTGSGMFIQVALWLRKLLSDREIVMRGIFLLPDIFINTLTDVGGNRNKRTRHYANAYAAIRELNAVTKVTQSNSAEVMDHFKLGDLFDSQTSFNAGYPVFDYVFFVDYKDQRSTYQASIADYEHMVADMVYMQLYSPMAQNMKSEEDNFYQDFVANPVPKYGACGVSKAVYPVSSVKHYCAARAIQDALPDGWEKIDQEIEERIQEKRRVELETGASVSAVDRRYEFMRLFDEKAAAGDDELTRDLFFQTLRKQTKNETKGEKDLNGEIRVISTDKVDDFVQALKKERIARIVAKYGRTGECAIDLESFVEDEHDPDDMINLIDSDEVRLNSILAAFEAKADEYATAIADGVFAYSMADITERNRCSVQGLMTKLNDMGKWEYVHPLVARYLCYKLVERLKKDLGTINLESSRQNAVDGGDINERRQIFDLKITLKKEASAKDMIANKPALWPEASFMDRVETAYANFISKKIEYCETYQKECLQQRVYRLLIDRFELLIKQLEAFFDSLQDIKTYLAERIEKNVSQTNGIVGNTMYVYASGANKEQIYQTLDMGQNAHNSDVNKSVINSAHGRVCAQQRPEDTANADYKDVSAAAAFVDSALRIFLSRIEADSNNREKVELDLCTALRKQNEAEWEADGTASTVSGLNDLDEEDGTIQPKHSSARRHGKAFKKCRDKLISLAAPYLRHEKQVREKDEDPDAAWPKIFWGYHPALVKAYPSLGEDLGINEELQANDAYPKSELHCYRAVYGLEARYIPKFNEMNNGDYYTNYKRIIDSMESAEFRKKDGTALVRTLHLDKSWHRILPFVSEEKQTEAAQSFFRGLWLGIAYGYIGLDKDGNFCIKRQVDSGYGSMMEETVQILYHGDPVGKTDVAKLIDALRVDVIFANVDIPAYEALFAQELKDLATYVGTRAMKGLTKKNEFLQPVDMIARYCSGAMHRKGIAAAMLNGLERIAESLVGNYNLSRSDESKEKAKFERCREFYAAASRKNLKDDVFKRWIAKFDDMKPAETTEKKK